MQNFGQFFCPLLFVCLTLFEKSNFCPKIQFCHEFFTQIFLTIFLVKSKLSTAKKSKTKIFSRVFHPPKIDNFLGKSKLNFWTKNEDFVLCKRCLLPISRCAQSGRTISLLKERYFYCDWWWPFSCFSKETAKRFSILIFSLIMWTQFTERLVTPFWQQ